MFFRKKPLVKDLLGTLEVDIHSHVLFGIDDGAKTAENSIELIQNLEIFGYKKLIATPHIIKNLWDNDGHTIQTKLDETKHILTSINNTVNLQAAAEYMMDHYFFELLKSNSKLLTLKDNYVLVEMSYINPPIQLLDIIFELSLNQYIPVLAHPERYVYYHQDFKTLYKLKELGVLFQANIPSLSGYYGPYISKCLDQLLKENLIDFLGSDVHHTRHINTYNNQVKLNNYKGIEKIILKTNQTFL